MNTPALGAKRITMLLSLFALAASAPSGTIDAEPGVAPLGTGAALRKSVIAAGGGQSSAASITVRGTAGQPIASGLIGSTIRVSSGYWVVQSVPPFCFGDANFDGFVNFADITAVLANFNTTGPAPHSGDANASGVVDFADITSVLTVFYTVCGG